MVRAARTGTGRRDPGELIQEPSWGGVLSAFGAAATASVGDLRLTLVGHVQESRGTGEAGIGPFGLWPTAELFTSSDPAVFLDRFPRW
jgi:hypothetical protein